MQRFSEQLQQLVKSRKIAVCALAEQSGVGRTLIHKMLKGERVPAKREAVQALSSALMLTPEENRALFESWLAAKMGEGVYARRKFVLDFYNQFDSAPETNLVWESGQRPVRVLSENGVVYGNLEVRNLAGAVLETEAAKESGHIRIVAQPECSHLFDFLSVLGRRRKSMTVDHVLCLENSQNEQNGLYNLSSLRSIIPILASGCRYRLQCYYDSVAGHFGSTSILPYLILTEDYAVRIAHDASCAAVSSLPQYLTLYGRIFETLMEKSESFVTVFHSPLEQISYINRLYDDFACLEHDFTSDPCLLVFAGEDMVRRHLSPALLKQEATVRAILEYMKFAGFKSRMKNMGNVYFSENGLDRFLATGRLTEVPAEYYSPLDQSNRYRLLRSMYEASLAGDYHPVLVNGQKLRIPGNLCTYSMKNGAVCFTYTAPRREHTTFLVTEQSVVTAIQDFLDYLPESDFVYSHEETLRYLKKKLENAPF